MANCLIHRGYPPTKGAQTAQGHVTHGACVATLTCRGSRAGTGSACRPGRFRSPSQRPCFQPKMPKFCPREAPLATIPVLGDLGGSPFRGSVPSSPLPMARHVPVTAGVASDLPKGAEAPLLPQHPGVNGVSPRRWECPAPPDPSPPPRRELPGTEQGHRGLHPACSRLADTPRGAAWCGI